MKIQEDADLITISKLNTMKTNLLPLYGPCNFFNHIFFLLHKSAISLYVPYQIAFQDYPSVVSVAFDTYLDIVFFIDIILTFNRPIHDANLRIITDRKVIALKYLATYFIFDLLSCFPFSYFKMASEHLPRSKDDLHNLLTGNFNSVPRFYKLMLIIKILRIRGIIQHLTIVLKKTSLRIQIQSIIITGLQLAFVVNLFGCLWRAGSGMNLYSNKSWLRSAGLLDATEF